MRKNNITDIIIIGDTMKKLLLSLVLLIVSITYINVYALNDGYYLIVDGTNITVKDDFSSEPISDYSNIVSVEDGKVVLHENVQIEQIEVKGDTILTSKNKQVYINRIYNSYSISTYPSLTIEDTLITSYDMPDRYSRVTIDRVSQLVLKNTTIENIAILTTSKNGFYMYNSHINDNSDSKTQFNIYGDIEIKDSSIKSSSMDDEDSNITIENSTIITEGNIYTEGNSSSIYIRNSYIKGTGSNPCLQVQLGPRDSHGLYIENSTIEMANVSLMAYPNNHDENILMIKNSNIITKILLAYTKIIVDNSTIDATSIAYNSTANDEYQGGIELKNSIVHSENQINSNGYFKMYNSKVDSEGPFNADYFDINKSYFKIIYGDAEYPPNRLFTYKKGFKAHDSYFYIESDNVEDLFYGLETAPVIDDGLYFLDKNKKKLKVNKEHYHDENTFYDYVYDYDYYTLLYDNNTKSNSAYLSSKKTITFKIQGGTWADGTTDDIVITKDIWTKLTTDEIPTGMLGNGEGYWKVIPSTEDYIKDDLEFVYVFGKVKGEEEVTNPKTGVFTYTSFIIALLLISNYIYSKYKHKTHYKYN